MRCREYVETSRDNNMVDKKDLDKLRGERLRLLAMSVDLQNEADRLRDNVKRLEGAIEALEKEAEK